MTEPTTPDPAKTTPAAIRAMTKTMLDFLAEESHVTGPRTVEAFRVSTERAAVMLGCLRLLHDLNVQANLEAERNPP